MHSWAAEHVTSYPWIPDSSPQPEQGIPGWEEEQSELATASGVSVCIWSVCIGELRRRARRSHQVKIQQVQFKARTREERTGKSSLRPGASDGLLVPGRGRA